MTYDSWQEALVGMVKEKGLEGSELAEISARASENGSARSNGPVGARGPLTLVSEILAPPPTDVSTTPEDGSNTFQGHVWAISCRSKGALGDAFTLTVCFDSKTATRLHEKVFGPGGRSDTEDAEFFPMTLILEPPST